VAAVSKVATIEKCENVTVCVATSVLRIGNCIDCQIFSFTRGLPPVVYGDTRNLRLGPHNASYPGMLEHFKRAGLKIENQAIDKLSDWFKLSLNHFKVPLGFSKNEDAEKEDKKVSSIVQPLDFSKFVLPNSLADPLNKFEEKSLITWKEAPLAPPDYNTALEMRIAAF
jgi:hypothetical protein